MPSAAAANTRLATGARSRSRRRSRVSGTRVSLIRMPEVRVDHRHRFAAPEAPAVSSEQHAITLRGGAGCRTPRGHDVALDGTSTAASSEARRGKKRTRTLTCDARPLEEVALSFGEHAAANDQAALGHRPRRSEPHAASQSGVDESRWRD